MMLAAVLSVQNIFYMGREPSAIVKTKKRLGAKEGDHVTLINIFIRYDHIRSKNDKKSFCFQNHLNERSLNAAVQVYAQLEKMMKKLDIPIKSSEDDVESIMRCIVAGFFDKAAQRQPDGSYKGVRSKDALYLHPQSILNAVFPEWVLYHEIVRTGKNYMREVSEIDYRWLLEVAPHFYEDNKVKILEAKRKKELYELEMVDRQVKKVKTEKEDVVRKPQGNTTAKGDSKRFVISDMDFEN